MVNNNLNISQKIENKKKKMIAEEVIAFIKQYPNFIMMPKSIIYIIEKYWLNILTQKNIMKVLGILICIVTKMILLLIQNIFMN